VKRFLQVFATSLFIAFFKGEGDKAREADASLEPQN
jgi:hypothetical protein